MTEPRLLLLTPSRGFGGGIERVADAIEHAWPGRVHRVDLYRPREVQAAHGAPAAKARFAVRATAAAARMRPDVVFANHVGLLPVAFACPRSRGGHVRSLGLGIEAWRPMSRLERSMVRGSRPLAISAYTAEHLAHRAGIAPGGVPVLPLAVQPQFAEIARAPRTCSGRRPLTLLTVSRISSENRYKGHFDVAASLPAVLEHLPDVRWNVIGDGDDVEALRARCQALGIASAVRLRGSVDEIGLLDAYGEADVLVLPSIADAQRVPPVGEGFGLVYAEAACFRLPSVGSTEGGGALDFVENEVTGLLTPPQRPDALADAVLRLAREPALRERLGQAAHARVVARHLPEHFAAHLTELLIPAGSGR